MQLPAEGTLRRLPRWGWRRRPASFFDRFDSRTLFYDCFRGSEDGEVLLVGPPPLNLKREFRDAEFVALPSGQKLEARFYPSLSTMITRLDRVPDGTRSLAITFGGETREVPVQASYARQFAGRRVLFTMSKDNELTWIADWASYYARRHRTDTLIFFDNGSTSYTPEDIAAKLSGIAELEDIVVMSWPLPYGAIDGAVLFNPYWTQFLQVSAMGVVLRRFASRAAGILNADIDELVHTPPEQTVYELATASPHGLVSMQGQWIEPHTNGPPQPASRHSDFSYRSKNPRERLCRARKWIIDPTRDWFAALSVHPYMHWIEGRPAGAKHVPDETFFWHFKGINTNWKVQRAEMTGGFEGLEQDSLWEKAKSWIA